MALASIQFSQATSPAAGESVLGFSKTGIVTLTDAGGAGAFTYAWSVQAAPATLVAFPTITSPTTQVATVNPVSLPGSLFVDGLYVVKLVRNDLADGVTTDTKFFGVGDDDGLHLPTASVNRNMSNVGGSIDAQRAGWFGSVIGGTNSLLDAYLRLRRSREDGYLGHLISVANAAGPTLETVTAGTSQSFRRITMSAAGTYTSQLADPAVEVNRIVRYQVIFGTGAGNFIVKTVSGTILLTLPAPSFVASTYNIVFKSDGVTWQLYDLDVIDLSINQGAGLLREKVRTDIPFVSTLTTTDRDVFQKIGSVSINPSIFPSFAVARLEATLNVRLAGTAQARLFNVTTGTTIGATLSGTSLTPTKVVSASFALTAGENMYEVQLRNTTSLERAFCSHSQVVVQWG